MIQLKQDLSDSVNSVHIVAKENVSTHNDTKYLRLQSCYLVNLVNRLDDVSTQKTKPKHEV